MDKRYGYNWNEAAIERLKTLWAEGYSASEVGAVLGVSRNSVIGKLHRLGLTGMPRRRTRPKGSNAPKMPAPPPRRKPVAQLLKTPEQVSKKQPAPFTLTLLELGPRHCKWPCDEDVMPYTFCGEQRVEESPYCSEHHKRAHQRGSQGVIERTFEPMHSSSKFYRFGKMAA